MSAAPKLSALVVIRNEEERLPGCLATLDFADEIVVVLDGCTDGSKAIAEAAGAVTVEGRWPIEGDRRNLGIATCTGDWVLEVDADERATPALGAEIRATVAAAAASGTTGRYRVPILNFVGARPIRYGWGAHFGIADKAILFTKGAKDWGLQRVHPKVTFSAPELGMLTERLEHYVDRDVSDMLKRLDSYSRNMALDHVEQGRVGNFANALRRFFSRSFKCYVQRKGYREGWWGVLIALCAGLLPVLTFLRAKLEAEKRG